MKYKKQNIVGDKFVHVFEKADGTIFEVPTDEQDYKQLGKPNPINPTNPEGTWKNSQQKVTLDTASGDLEAGQYLDVGDEVIVTADGVRRFVIPKSAFTNGSITLE